MSVKQVKPRRSKLAISGLTIIGLSLFSVGLSLGRWQNVGSILHTSAPNTYLVTKVDDGDTIVVAMPSGQETVRLLGVDTPETKDPRKPIQCFGQSASRHTTALTLGKQVRLEADPINDDRDKYKRLLRYVYLPDGSMLNTALVRDGYAFAYTVFPLTKVDEFVALEKEARRANRGLWQSCSINEQTKVKQTQAANE